MSDFELPQTPAGAWLAWWIGMLNRGGEGAQLPDWDRYSPAFKESLRAPLTVETLRADRAAGELDGNAERVVGIAGRYDRSGSRIMILRKRGDPPAL